MMMMRRTMMLNTMIIIMSILKATSIGFQLLERAMKGCFSSKKFKSIIGKRNKEYVKYTIII
jgi:hypothetical protein